MGHTLKLRQGCLPLIASAGLAAALLSSAAASANAAGTGYSASRVPGGALAIATAVDPATNTIYVVGSSGLEVVDGATDTASSMVSLTDAVWVAVDSATDTVYVTIAATGSSGGAIDVINGATDALTTTITEPTGDSPVGIAIDASTDTIFVANPGGASTDGNIAVIDGATNAITATIDTGASTRPFGIAFDGSTDTAWVAEESGAVIAVSETTDKIVRTVSLGTSEPVWVAVDPATDSVYATDAHNKDVAVIDGTSGALVTTIPAGSDVYGVAVDQTTDTVYATAWNQPLGTTWVIDGTSNKVTDTLARGGLGVAFDDSTGTAYVAGERQGGAWIITPAAENAWSPVITSPAKLITKTGTPASLTVQANAEPAATISETGTLPAGVTLSSDGLLSGTPATTAGGSYPIVITASNGIAPDSQQSFSLVVDQPPIIATAAAATFQAGTAGSVSLPVSGYPAPSLLAEGQLPAGVGISETSSGWQLAGTPVKGSGGVYQFAIVAQNASGRRDQSFTLTVNQAPAFTSAPRAAFRAGRASNYFLDAGEFPAPTFTEAGQLPYGISLDPRGVLLGTPGRHSGGVYHFTLTASNGIGSAAQQAFTLTIDQPPAITAARSATFRAGSRRTFTFRSTGFPVATLSERGHLPGGVRFVRERNGTAILTGKAARSDKGKTYKITISAANGVGPPAHQTFRLKVS